MNDDELWGAIDAQRLRIADLLDDLREEEWRAPSLCTGWTVREVAAHLTLQQVGLLDVLPLALRYRGDVNRVIDESTRRAARGEAAGFAPRIRAMVGSRRRNFGVTAQETLIDVLVHGLDIAVPLGRELVVPPLPCRWAADRVRSYGGGSKAKVFGPLQLDGVRLVADDIDWSAGEGPEVRGPIASILLALTGRAAGLERLKGEGLALIGARR